MTSEVLRQQLICAAKADLARTVSHDAVVAYLRTLGVDVKGNPVHAAAFSTLVDGLRFGVPTPTALEWLGVAA